MQLLRLCDAGRASELIVCITAVCYCCAAEKQVLRDQAKSAGSSGKPKPANIIEKIISGRINKV